MDLHTWLIYLLAATGLSLSPGPNGLLALTHGALHGRRKALYTVAGGTLGFVAIIGLSMFGIGALLQTSVVWLTVMKWVGGAYLVWLGIQVWRAPPVGVDMHAPVAPASGGSLFRQGALSALTNPKGLLFFAAFLPQFIAPGAPAAPQLLLLGAVFGVLAVASDSCWALAAGRARDWFARDPKRLDRLGATGGVMMVGLGATLATTGSSTH